MSLEPTANGSLNTVAIDWAYAGIGALGSDLATLFSDAINDGFIAYDQTESLSTALSESYRRGLLETCSSIDPRALRFAYCATVPLKYLWIIPDLLSLAARTEPQQPLPVQLEQLSSARTRFARHLLALADEADSLRKSIG